MRENIGKSSMEIRNFRDFPWIEDFLNQFYGGATFGNCGDFSVD